MRKSLGLSLVLAAILMVGFGFWARAQGQAPDGPRVLVGGQLLERDCTPWLGKPAGPAAPAGPEGSRVLRLFAGGGGRPDTLFEALVPVGRGRPRRPVVL
jgi:hypothetical protein